MRLLMVGVSRPGRPPLTDERHRALSRRIRTFVGLSIAYNVVEAAIALTEGARASSTALIGFGLDSVVEVSSAAVVAWQGSAEDPETKRFPILAAAECGRRGPIGCRALASPTERPHVLIAMALYDRFTALDAVGPYEVLSRLPGVDTMFVADQPGPVTNDLGTLTVTATAGFDSVPHPDVVVVPGGPGQVTQNEGGPLIEWLRAVDPTTTWTTSVCTGALILGAAGFLSGRRATTHWLVTDQLADFGATPVHERVVVDGKYVTAAGVSAGIDMALTLGAEIAGEEAAQSAQLFIEYDPHPPFDAGSVTTAPASVVEALRARGRDLRN